MRPAAPAIPVSPERSGRMRPYAADYAGWVDDTARAIEEGRFDDIDRHALAEEIRDLGKSETARLESALRVLLIHLLKAKYQPDKHSRSWDNTISVQRLHLQKFLRTSPSLRARLDEFVADVYETARYDAENQTGIFIDTFPEKCEWTAAEILGAQTDVAR